MTKLFFILFITAFNSLPSFCFISPLVLTNSLDTLFRPIESDDGSAEDDGYYPDDPSESSESSEEETGSQPPTALWDSDGEWETYDTIPVTQEEIDEWQQSYDSDGRTNRSLNRLMEYHLKSRLLTERHLDFNDFEQQSSDSE